MLLEEDRMTETCRIVLSVLLKTIYDYICGFVGVLLK